MSIELWFLLIGLLMLSRGLGSRYLQRLPFTSANVYLAVGLLLGPTILNLFYFDPIKQSVVLEKLTEFAVLISLFSAGVKMPVRAGVSASPTLNARNTSGARFFGVTGSAMENPRCSNSSASGAVSNSSGKGW